MSRVLAVGAAVVGLATVGGCVAVPGGGAIPVAATTRCLDDDPSAAP